jgi:hypothetical protein
VLVTQAGDHASKDVLFALQSGFEPMVVRMIDLTTKLVHVVRECVREQFRFFIAQRERHRDLLHRATTVHCTGGPYKTRSGEQ